MVSILYNGVSLNDADNGVYVDFPEDLGTPPVRGDNVTIPFRHGSISTQKYYGERTIVIQGYVWGDNRTVLWSRIDRLKQAFMVLTGPKKLEVRWPDGTTRYLRAEVRNTMGFQGTHRTFSPFSVELSCPDPFWRDDSAAQEAPYIIGVDPVLYIGDPEFLIADYDSTYDVVLTAPHETFAINNPGIIPLEDSKFTLTTTHPLTSITVKNLHSGSQFKITTDIPAGAIVTVDSALYQATMQTTSDFIDITQYMVTPPGQRAPFLIPTGNSTVDVTLTDGGTIFLVTVALYFAAAYL